MPRTPDSQPVTLSGMDKPALHPERIRWALRYFQEVANGSCDLLPDTSVIETARAGLELIRKSQLAVGLTGQVVDAGRSAMDLLDALKRIGK